ncbi:hypothetical protein [Halodesulfovibrio marinisediminis]|uniref:Uncharacterized protein n=1 Tax=Halodesulfovibrio marinisediminis DSM 17456 TaxID=1121457 RepID=A0A1N6DIY8_9BACT|nr:hypothetical protein [Halodesulfovibrio marinisediminis]SIN70781.1 hypothetical protein SAMN02745161_0199 [Halodesulfovibrio marinisediminis DSM 17456]
MNDMLALDFSNTGYIYMFIIWSIAGIIGAALAHKKGRNPFFWGILCLIIPMALFAIGGMRAPGEPVPEMFRKDNNTDSPQ